jgi:hypothetical protein
MEATMTPQERTEVLACIVGLLAIAKIAMPDTYYQSDSRVIRAVRLMKAQRAYATLRKKARGARTCS